MMITLSEPIMVTFDACIAKHHTINARFFKLVVVLAVIVNPFAASALFLGFFTQFYLPALSKRLNPEHSGALSVKQATHAEVRYA
jgi:hypothetical protein